MILMMMIYKLIYVFYNYSKYFIYKYIYNKK